MLHDGWPDTLPEPCRLKAAAHLAPQPDPTLLITDGRERTDGFGTTGQQPDTLITWKFEPKNALYYDSSSRDVVPFTGWCTGAPLAGGSYGLGLGSAGGLCSAPAPVATFQVQSVVVVQ